MKIYKLTVSIIEFLLKEINSRFMYQIYMLILLKMKIIILFM
jgi:hypothetical protein